MASAKEFASLDCAKFVFHKGDKSALKGLSCFDNELPPRNSLDPVSKGQFNRVLSGYRVGGYGCRAGDGGEPVDLYQKDDLVGPVDRAVLLGGQPARVDAEFYCDGGDPLFLDDYANWILVALAERYPLFSWRGHKR